MNRLLITAEEHKVINALKEVTRWFEVELNGNPNRKNTYRQMLLDKCYTALENTGIWEIGEKLKGGNQ